MNRGKIELQGVAKKFGRVSALEEVDLLIEPGELFTLLGPSGCGKTTILRTISGLEEPTSGVVRINDRVVNDLSPGERDIALVFQSYALYGHMSAFDNIAFPLRTQKVAREEIKERVGRVAKFLELEELLDRKPGQLSGGQQQRVALGRAVVREPSAFLMDEPLSNLDARLRLGMRAQLKHLQGSLGTTMVYVTHDQEEAMTMSSRIAVLEKGRLLQVGTPAEIYGRPQSVQVATFVGSLPMNLMELSVASDNGTLLLRNDHASIRPSAELGQRVVASGLERILLGVRPEDTELTSTSPDVAEDVIQASVFLVEPIGDRTVVDFKVGDAIYKCQTHSENGFVGGEQIWVSWSSKRVHLFDPTTSQRVA